MAVEPQRDNISDLKHFSVWNLSMALPEVTKNISLVINDSSNQYV
jgi:hypothetical protein